MYDLGSFFFLPPGMILALIPVQTVGGVLQRIGVFVFRILNKGKRYAWIIYWRTRRRCWRRTNHYYWL